ncbi:MAG: TetR/AcrR family transcriptional regulator [Thermoleophilaceae bacterium]
MSVYAGVSAEDRRAGRRARLLEAGLDLVGSDGWQAAGVRAICSRARLTPRYFYESFENREALLVAIFDSISEEAAGRVVEAVVAAPEDAEAKSRAAVESFVDLLVEDPRKARVMFVEAMGIEALERRRHEVLRMFARLIRDQGREFYGRPAGSDRILDTTAFLLAGGLAELLLAWLDGELSSSRDELVDDCAALLAATGEAAAAIARERTRT